MRYLNVYKIKGGSYKHNAETKLDPKEYMQNNHIYIKFKKGQN